MTSEWQICPLCRGVGGVSGGYFDRAGDCDSWASTGSNVEQCRICEGKGIIARPTLQTISSRERRFRMLCPVKFSARVLDSSDPVDVERFECHREACAWWCSSPKIPGEGDCAIQMLAWAVNTLERHYTRRE